MSCLVRKGDFLGAAELGNAQETKLAVPKTEAVARDVLGRGTESTIFAADYQGANVALKKMTIRCTADLERFRKEVALLNSLNHAHVVPLLAARVLPPDYAMVLPRYACSLEVRRVTFAWSNWQACCLVDAECPRQ